jgi:hypothetical protein
MHETKKAAKAFQQDCILGTYRCTNPIRLSRPLSQALKTNEESAGLLYDLLDLVEQAVKEVRDL